MASQGKIDVAIDDVRTISRLAAQVDRTQPCLVNGLVGIGLQSIACSALVEVLPNVVEPTAIPPDVLPDETAFAPSFTRDLQGEEDMITATMLDFADGTAPLEIDKKGMALAGSYYRCLWLRGDVDAIRSEFARQRELARIGDPTTKSQADPSGSPLVQIMFPSLGRMRSVELQLIANASQARIAIALTKYRLKHASYPATLETLVPEFLPAVPPDPFDGKPMKYRMKDGDGIIYSIGRDLKDNGGQIADPPDDVGFRLRHAKAPR